MLDLTNCENKSGSLIERISNTLFANLHRQFLSQYFTVTTAAMPFHTALHRCETLKHFFSEVF